MERSQRNSMTDRAGERRRGEERRRELLDRPTGMKKQAHSVHNRKEGAEKEKK